jgi:hypothetical protein
MAEDRLDAFELGRWGVNVVRTPHHQEEGAFLRAQNAEPQTNKAQKGIGKRFGISAFTADLGDMILALANINLVPAPEAPPDPATGEPQTLGDFGPAALNTMRAKTYLTAATTSVANTTETSISWTAEAWDVGNLHDLATNPTRFTVPTGGDGLYFVEGQVQFAANATGIRSVRIYVNGAIVARNDYPAGTTDGLSFQVTAVLALIAADYVEVKVYQSSGGALNMTGAVETATFATLIRLLSTTTTTLPRCQAVRTTNLSLGNGVATAIALDGETFDTHTMHDNSTNNSRVTVPAAQDGLYHMVGQFAFSAAFIGSWTAELRKNGATSLAKSAGIGGNRAGQDVTGQVSVLATMAATDYVELVITQTATGGGAFSILGGGLNTTNLQVARVG